MAGTPSLPARVRPPGSREPSRHSAPQRHKHPQQLCIRYRSRPRRLPGTRASHPYSFPRRRTHRAQAGRSRWKPPGRVRRCRSPCRSDRRYTRIRRRQTNAPLRIPQPLTSGTVDSKPLGPDSAGAEARRNSSSVTEASRAFRRRIPNVETAHCEAQILRAGSSVEDRTPAVSSSPRSVLRNKS